MNTNERTKDENVSSGLAPKTDLISFDRNRSISIRDLYSPSRFGTKNSENLQHNVFENRNEIFNNIPIIVHPAAVLSLVVW